MDDIESGGVGIVRTIALSDWIAEAERSRQYSMCVRGRN